MRGKEGIYWTVLCLGLLIILWNVTPGLHLANFYMTSGSELKPTIREFLIAGVIHDKIIIDGNDNFEETVSNEGWMGNGSEENPYIIDGYDIDLGGAAGHCISISNTQVYFIISHCYLTGASINPGAGIYLNSVLHGSIINNTILKNYNGIFLINCDNNTIVDNTSQENNGYAIYLYGSDDNSLTNNICNTNSYSIYLEASHYNNITNNICYSNYIGIQLDGSDSNLLKNNTCYSNTQAGIYLYMSSDSNTLINNTCYSAIYGISISFSLSNSIINNFCYENSESGIYSNNSNHTIIKENNCFSHNVDGINLLNSYFNTIIRNICYENDNSGIILFQSESNSLTNNICYQNVMCGIALSFSNNSELFGNECSNSVYGIYLVYSMQNELDNNTCYFNIDTGIYLIRSYYNALSENTCHDNSIYNILLEEVSLAFLTKNMCYNSQIGISLELSGYNIITKNTCHDNNLWGIHFGTNSDLNDCSYNAFIENNINADDDGSLNSFDYNYYSDYLGSDIDGNAIGDYPYTFTSNEDIHPLMYLPTPPIFQETPGDFVIEFGYSYFQLKLNATCPTTMAWNINNTLFTIDSQGKLASGFLPIGEYTIAVVVSNIYGIGTSVSFSVTVSDTTSPSWLIIPVDKELEYGEAFVYQVAATDLTGIDHWSINDTVNFSVDEYGVITNKTVLLPGVYTLNIAVFDSYDNILSKDFSITVNTPRTDTSPPEWLKLTVYHYIEYGEPVWIQVEAWDESGIHHMWINDTDHFIIDTQGIIQNASILETGIYNLEVRAFDFNDNFCTAVIVLIVLESEISSTTTFTNMTSSLAGLNPIVTLALGVGIGGATMLVLFVVFLRRSTTK